ncbi:MAG: mevalonate kinase [Flavobacteriaceae bacterium]|jgi:mevalonate kinase
MSTEFYSNGKLLLSGEYLVLDGAMALSIPTKYGQSMLVESSEAGTMHWKSLDANGNIWFENSFVLSELNSDKNAERVANSTKETLLKILQEAKKLNPKFLTESNGWSVTTTLNFPQNWGLGSSSTLINNIAQWARINAFELLRKSFGGSGYDIAVAQNNSSILYKIQDGVPFVEKVKIHWDFTDQLFFVHLNQKQNSKEGIEQYRKVSISIIELSKVSAITYSLLACETLEAFEKLIDKHELLISEIIQTPTIKTQLFSDYQRSIKSLGAWGGDFILVTATPKDLDYFKNMGYNTIIPFAEMIL